MNLGSYPEPTDLEKRILARREARGKGEAILSILAARSLEVSAVMQRRVLGCADLEELEIWLVRAVRVEDAEDIFAPH